MLYIRKPDRKHKTFRLIQRVNTKFTTFHSPELEIINSLYRGGRHTYQETYERIQQLAAAMEPPKPIPSALTANERLVEEFWNTSEKGRLKPRKTPLGIRSAHYRLRSVAKTLHRLDLRTASALEVQLIIQSYPREKQIKIVDTVNTLWKWLDRPARVPRPRAGRQKEIQFFTLPEVLGFTKRLPYPVNLMILTMFGTGARPGEVMAMQPDALRENGTHIYVDKSMTREWKITETKNYLIGNVYIIPECRKGVSGWLAVPDKIKRRIWHRSTYSRLFKSVAGRRPYCLRHSYARYMIKEKGATLTDLKSWMRDAMPTIEKNYVSWLNTDPEMKNNVRRFG